MIAQRIASRLVNINFLSSLNTMRCSQCSRRNNSANRFCIFCAAPLTEPKKRNQIVMPPQDIANAVSGKKLCTRTSGKQTVLSPIIAGCLLIIVCIGIAYYIIYYIDTYQVQAIEYYSGYDEFN